LALADCQTLKEIIAYKIRSLERFVNLRSDYGLAIASVAMTGFIKNFILGHGCNLNSFDFPFFRDILWAHFRYGSSLITVTSGSTARPASATLFSS